MGCAHSPADKVATGTPAATVEATVVTSAPVTSATTLPSTTPTTAAPLDTAATQTPASPAVDPAPAAQQDPAPPAAPEPATITVTYQPHDGDTATATLVETGETRSLADGSAVFGDLAAGTYTVEIDVTFPNTETSDGVGLGGGRAQKTKPIAVQPGDHAVVACDDNGCTAIS